MKLVYHLSDYSTLVALGGKEFHHCDIATKREFCHLPERELHVSLPFCARLRTPRTPSSIFAHLESRPASFNTIFSPFLPFLPECAQNHVLRREYAERSEEKKARISAAVPEPRSSQPITTVKGRERERAPSLQHLPPRHVQFAPAPPPAPRPAHSLRARLWPFRRLGDSLSVWLPRRRVAAGAEPGSRRVEGVAGCSLVGMREPSEEDGPGGGGPGIITGGLGLHSEWAGTGEAGWAGRRKGGGGFEDPSKIPDSGVMALQPRPGFPSQDLLLQRAAGRLVVLSPERNEIYFQGCSLVRTWT